ncbi:MAG: hypothetical protein KDD43_01735 [Bdellovibrionales bacterium]|nr:hypothetical protein [Bdellovibrionales bacterium]
MILIVPTASELWRWMCVWFVLCGFHFFCEIHVFQRESGFQEHWVSYLDRLLARMRAGSTLRSALEILEQEEEGFAQAKIAQIRASVVFLQHTESIMKESKMGELIRELRIAHHEPHQSVRRLRNLRRKLSVEVGFRRRSGQVLFQMRIQAWILSGLYLAMLVFVLIRDGTGPGVLWVVGSGIMFVCGLVWLMQLGRRIRWKV